MRFGSSPFAQSTLAGNAHQAVVVAAPGGSIGGPAEIPLVIDPFSVEISGLTYKPLINTLSIDNDSNRQGTASFTLCNIRTMVQIGQPVRIFFYDKILFAGSIDRVTLYSNNTETYKTYALECVDDAFLLTRKKVNKKYTNANVVTIANDMIVHYLGGEGFTIGSFDNGLPLPTVDAQNMSIYDVLRESSQALGMLFYVDLDRQMHFKSASSNPAPVTIDENIVESCESVFDREGYRNYQTVIVTGTPALGSSTPAVTVSYTATNGTQIGEQATIENGEDSDLGNGVYIESESITHPTSNAEGELLKLAVSTARSLLAVNGEMRQTLTIKTRQYGFETGQFATVSIPHLGITGEWVIQRVTMSDESGRWLITSMELSRSSVRRLKFQLWLDIARKGKITVVPLTAAVTQSQTFSTPGVDTFTVPAGITMLQVTCCAAGGGGGGPASSFYGNGEDRYSLGGTGGRGGKAISVISVTPGQVFTIVIPAGGAGGIGETRTNQLVNSVGTDGSAGGNARVSLGASTFTEAYGGVGGVGAKANSYTSFSGIWAPSPDGAGSGNVVTVGGGALGGVSGLANPLQNSHQGSNGSVLVEW